MLIMLLVIDLVIIFITDAPGMNNTAEDRTKHSASPSLSPGKRLISSKALLGDEGSVLIEHNGQHYQLRQTQSGKLILTK